MEVSTPDYKGLRKMISDKVEFCCSKTVNFYSSLEFPSFDNIPNFSLDMFDNYYVSILNVAYKSCCYDKLQDLCNSHEPQLHLFTWNDLVSFREIILIGKVFMPLPIIPIYFDEKIVMFLKEIILCNKENYAQIDIIDVIQLKANTLILLLHFGIKILTTKDFSELMSYFFSSMNSSQIIFHYTNYFKDFWLLFKKVIHDIHTEQIINEHNKTNIKLILRFAQIICFQLKKDIVNNSDVSKLWMYEEVLNVLFKNENNLWYLEDLSRLGADFLVNNVKDLM